VIVNTCVICVCSVQGKETERKVVSAQEGDDVQLPCPGSFTGNGSAGDIAWWNDEDRVVLLGKVQPDYQNRMTFDPLTGDLVIHKVSPDDSGFYWCSEEFHSYGIFLNVIGPYLRF